MNASLKHFTDNDFGKCRILHNENPDLTDACLFASHTILPRIPEYVYHYLSEIKKAGLSLIFISSSSINENDISKLIQYADIIVEKENRGTDFGAWCSVLRQIDFGEKSRHLYLCNDSVFGPFIPFSEIHDTFLTNQADILGITDSYQGSDYHIQSYFIGFKNQVLTSTIWKKFWKQMSFQQEKRKVIEYYEIGLTQILLRGGFSHYIWSDWSKSLKYNQILAKVSRSPSMRQAWLNRILLEKENIIYQINPSSFLWQELVSKCRSPFLKRELFTLPHIHEECGIADNWQEILNRFTNYRQKLIHEFLVHYYFHKSWHHAMLNEGWAISLNSESKIPFSKEINSDQNLDPLHYLSSLFSNYGPVILSGDGSPAHKALRQMNIPNLNLCISRNNTNPLPCTIIYIPETIIEFSESQIRTIKETIKEISYAIIIAADEPTKYIASGILFLRPNGIQLARDLSAPSDHYKLIQELKQHYDSFSFGIGSQNPHLRPSLANVLEDALHGKNRTGFLHHIETNNIEVRDGQKNNQNELTSEQIVYGTFLEIRNKYVEIYEKTPFWYKKIGQVIKLVTGRKKLIIRFADKGLKDHYKPIPEDITHWYYIQYEILPNWYKRFGARILKSKRSNGKLPDMQKSKY